MGVYIYYQSVPRLGHVRKGNYRKQNRFSNRYRRNSYISNIKDIGITLDSKLNFGVYVKNILQEC